MSEPNKNQLRELDAWIGRNVFNAQPRVRAFAANADETVGFLFENLSDRTITKATIREFCLEHPNYHYAEQEEWPRFTTDPAAAMEVLEKCRLHTEQLYHDGEYFSVRLDLESNESSIYLLNQKMMETRHTIYFTGIQDMPLAICLFAKKLLTKGLI